MVLGTRYRPRDIETSEPAAGVRSANMLDVASPSELQEPVMAA
jgi:hypothetical protein